MKLGARASLVAVVALALPVSLFAAPGGAQAPSVSYAAEADGTGFNLALQGEDVITLSITHAELDSAPTVSGLADAFVQLGGARVETSAPPDDAQDTTAGPGTVGQPGLLEATVGILNASSASEAADGDPSGENNASVASVGVTAGPQGILEAVAGTGIIETNADVSAEGANVSAVADIPLVTISVSVEASALQTLNDETQLQDTLCPGLGDILPVLEETCNGLFETATGSQPVADITVLPSNATCTWDGSTPAADAAGAVASISLLGQEPIIVDVGEAVTIAEGTPLEITVGAGTESTQVNDDPNNEDDEATGRATGAFVELLDSTVELAFSDATCAVAGSAVVPVQPREEPPLPRTGGPVVPLLAAGSALAAAGLGLRRFLKR